MADDWFPPSGSSWHRIEGDGSPSDFSAGSSANGDWRGAEPEPVPPAFREAFAVPSPETTEPVESWEPWPPKPPTPAPQRYRPVDPVTGFRAWLGVAERMLNRQIKERDQ